MLGTNGWSQRRIARATKAQQSEISAIVQGRQVTVYSVLVRIAEGLAIPRERMGLSFGAYPGESTTAEPSKGGRLRRRAVELATDAGDAYRAAYAMRHAGMMLIHRSEPNNALKLLQLGDLRLNAAPRDDPRVSALRMELITAVTLLNLGQLDAAETAVATSVQTFQRRGKVALRARPRAVAADTGRHAGFPVRQ